MNALSDNASRRGNLPVSPCPFPWSASRTGRFAAGVDIEIKL
jgi:hypothetical protein